MFEALLSNRTVSVLVEALPRILTAGLTMTIPLTLVSFFFAMIIAVVVALVQYANVPVLRQIARFYIWVIRGTPLLVQLFIIFYGLPSLGIMLDAFPAAVIAFAFNEGAYCAETMRGALESVPQGQLEAGYCVGMSWVQIMRRIVLPQALRTAVPALSNSLIGMIKDTSLASNITVAELFMAGQRVAARTYIFLPIYCEVAVVYLLFCTVITKLQALLDYGVTRISVNPQTKHDETLARIGRRHTCRQTEEAYALARRMGFTHINMDLIAGLPGEDLRMFEETLAWLRSLAPESMTVHTLSIKRSSLLHLWEAQLPDGEMVADMVRAGARTAHEMGMQPYYLYRQKYMAGNQENVGYALAGHACLYNVEMMEETANVLAMGAGAASKRLFDRQGFIRRAFNVSDIRQYISRVDEMAQRKRDLFLGGNAPASCKSENVPENA